MTERRPLILRADAALPRLQELPVGDLLPTDTLGNAIKVLLQGLVTGNNAGITSTDTVLQALGKLQAQTSAKVDKDGAKVLSDNNFTNAERQKLEGIASGAQVNVATNLALGAATANAREITSSTGGSVTLPAATSSTAGLMTAAESTKLGTVATNASANSSDAFLLNRANHSGTQPLSTITGVGTAAAMNVLGVGGVIERGSNANGEYVKFADGTMIVTRTVQGYSAGVNYFDMAAVFASPPKCFCSIEPNQSWAKELGIYGSNQTWGVNFSAGDNNKILLTAIGVWKL